jgi:hypothetical protein
VTLLYPVKNAVSISFPGWYTGMALFLRCFHVFESCCHAHETFELRICSPSEQSQRETARSVHAANGNHGMKRKDVILSSSDDDKFQPATTCKRQAVQVLFPYCHCTGHGASCCAFWCRSQRLQLASLPCAQASSRLDTPGGHYNSPGRQQFKLNLSTSLAIPAVPPPAAHRSCVSATERLLPRQFSL